MDGWIGKQALRKAGVVCTHRDCNIGFAGILTACSECPGVQRYHRGGRHESIPRRVSVFTQVPGRVLVFKGRSGSVSVFAGD